MVKILSARSAGWILRLLTRLAYINWLRRLTFQWLASHLKGGPGKFESQRKLLYTAILTTVDRLMQRRTISPDVAGKVAHLWARALLVPGGQIPAVASFRSENGIDPPWFITIAPGHGCNLKCKGCYAASDSSGNKLAWPTLERLVKEAKDCWGIRLVVFSGGEPLLYSWGGQRGTGHSGAKPRPAVPNVHQWDTH